MGREREGASDKGDKWQESKESHSTKIYEGAEQTWKDQSKDRAHVKADDLGEKGRISSASGFEVFDSAKDVPPPPNIEVRSGRDLSRADLKEEGIKEHTEKHGHVTKSEVEFPNGVKVEHSKDTTPHEGKSGHATVTEVSGGIVTLPKDMEVKQTQDGTVVDKKTGHPVLKEMDDGSTRVWTDKGVYNVYPNGEVTKETAIKNRNGTWTIIDDKTPLGNLEHK